MERVICIIIGYAAGLFQTGFFYGKLHNIDIREHGSGNAGTTNISRTLGKKAGLITYAGDTLKAIICSVIIHFCFGRQNQDMELLYILYGGLGVILGHNHPFYLKFQGGKGIAATSGVILSLVPYNWIMAVLGFFTFVIVTKVSKYVSLGSLVMITCFLIEFVLFGQMGWYDVSDVVLYESYAVVLVMTVFGYVRHRANIVRLFKGTERKIGQKK